MTYKNILSIARKELSGLSNGANEARWILEFVLGKESYFSQKISQEQFDKIMKMVFQRKTCYPLEYILGTVDFLENTFDVCKDVLIPREDSGILVEYLRQNAPLNARILEIGTGTGILALSLKKNREDLKVQAIDINQRAIECSRSNEQRILGDHGYIDFVHGDFFQMCWESPFDIVLSNPPYLSEEEYRNLQKELYFEPKDALVGGQDGLLFYHAILERKKELIKPGGKLILEISPPRWRDLQKTVHEEKSISLLYDLHGMERGLVITRVD